MAAEKMDFYSRVSEIQKNLKAPKSQYNSFGKYSYRNQEDILEAVKELLNGLIMTVSDEIVEIGGRVYVKATATITDGTTSLSNTAYARESLEQKGMNESQITGSASSYARKYALNGLFLIDDTKDADTDEFQGKKSEAKPQTTKTPAKIAVDNLQKAAEEAVKAGAGVAVSVEVKTEEKPAVKTGKAGWGKPKAGATAQPKGEELY